MGMWTHQLDIFLVHDTGRELDMKEKVDLGKKYIDSTFQQVRDLE